MVTFSSYAMELSMSFRKSPPPRGRPAAKRRCREVLRKLVGRQCPPSLRLCLGGGVAAPVGNAIGTVFGISAGDAVGIYISDAVSNISVSIGNLLGVIIGNFVGNSIGNAVL